MTSSVVIDHLHRALRRMCDEDAAASSIEYTVIECAADRTRYFDHSYGSQRHEDLAPSRGRSVCVRTGNVKSVHVQSSRNAERCTGLGRRAVWRGACVSPYPQISGDGIQSQGIPWLASVNISGGANSPIRVHAGSVHGEAELNVASAWSAGFPSAPATGKMPD